MTTPPPPMMRADTRLVEGWLKARSLARGLPAPVADHGGWRIDTKSPAELRRYVFSRPISCLGDLARTIDNPRIYLKLFGSAVEMQRLLPPGWRLQTGNMMMTCQTQYLADAVLPLGYSSELMQTGAATRVQILSHAGAVAASGYAAEVDDVFVYDRIVVAPDHRRRGLGRAVMATLGSARRSPAATNVLVATEQGRALYSTLNWQDHSPYTTAVLPDDEQSA